jgi:hypothetical protein
MHFVPLLVFILVFVLMKVEGSNAIHFLSLFLSLLPFCNKKKKSGNKKNRDENKTKCYKKMDF